MNNEPSGPFLDVVQLCSVKGNVLEKRRVFPSHLPAGEHTWIWQKHHFTGDFPPQNGDVQSLCYQHLPVTSCNIPCHVTKPQQLHSSSGCNPALAMASLAAGAHARPSSAARVRRRMAAAFSGMGLTERILRGTTGRSPGQQGDFGLTKRR